MKRIAWAAALLPILAVLAGCGSSGSNGQSEGLDTSFDAPASYSLPQLEQKRYPCGKENEHCAISYLQKLTTKYGPQASLGVLNAVETSGEIDPTFDTHQLAHLVGEATARRFGANKQAFGLCPQTFNYGCVHGFFIYVLGRSASPTKAARTICDSGGQGPARPDLQLLARGRTRRDDGARERPPGLARRLRLARQRERGRRLAGRACSWRTSTPSSATRRGRASSLRRHPLRPCTRVLSAYKQECFINQAGWLAHLANDDIGKAARYCLDAGKYVSACAQSIGLMVTNPSWQLPFYGPAKGASFEQIAWDLCSAFPSEAPARLRARRRGQPRQLRPAERQALGRLLRLDRTAAEDVLPRDRRQPHPADDGRGGGQGALQRALVAPGRLHRRDHAGPASRSADQGAEREARRSSRARPPASRARPCA